MSKTPMPLKSAARLTECRTGFEGTSYRPSVQWFRIFMPYCFQRLVRPGHVWLPLNRNYKPLGFFSSAHVDYEAYAHMAVRFARDPARIEGLWRDVQRTDILWLYSDLPSSRQDYFERLERLCSYSMPLDIPLGTRVGTTGVDPPKSDYDDDGNFIGSNFN